MTRVGAHTVEHIDSGTGPALLALHGGMGGYDQSWLLARALLANVASHRVLAVSRPGYLRTSLAAGESAEEQADLFARLLDTLRIDRVLVGAVSAGGAPALQFALRHRDRCRGLVLVSAVTGQLEVNSKVEKRLRAMRAIARVPGIPWLIRRRVTRDPNAAASRSIPDPVIRDRTLADTEAGSMLQELQVSVTRDLSRRLPGTFNDTRRLGELASIPLAEVRVPVLAIHGKADDVVPYSHAELLAASSPSAEVLGIDGAGHVVLFTHLATVRKSVQEFDQTLN